MTAAPSDTPACKHEGATVEFDCEASKGLSDSEVRRRWLLFDGYCHDCGQQLIKYASFEHYISGDW